MRSSVVENFAIQHSSIPDFFTTFIFFRYQFVDNLYKKLKLSKKVSTNKPPYNTRCRRQLSLSPLPLNMSRIYIHSCACVYAYINIHHYVLYIFYAKSERNNRNSVYMCVCVCTSVFVGKRARTFPVMTEVDTFSLIPETRRMAHII